MPYKVNESRRHNIPRARYRVENWAAYDAAQRRRGDLTIWVTPEAITAWTPPATGRRGRPARYSDLAIETALLVRLVFHQPLRQTEGLLGSLLQLLGLDLPVPDHTTLSRRSAKLTPVLQAALPDGPVRLVLDSTGLKVYGAGEWLADKQGARGPRSWRKLHLCGRDLLDHRGRGVDDHRGRRRLAGRSLARADPWPDHHGAGGRGL